MAVNEGRPAGCGISLWLSGVGSPRQASDGGWTPSGASILLEGHPFIMRFRQSESVIVMALSPKGWAISGKSSARS